jgi:selenocysteine lyase/cysteine desulfurase
MEQATVVFEPNRLGPAESAFAADHPDFAPNGAVARLRRTEYHRLDADDQVYLDYTGGGMHANSQIDAHLALLRQRVLGNPHSNNPTSLAMTELVERARSAVREFFRAPRDEYLCVFTPNASGALRLIGESYRFEPGGRFALTFDNHNSVNGIREFARRAGAEVTYVPVVAGELRLDRSAMTTALASGDPDRRNLLAFPAQSNFSGVQHPLELVDEAHDLGWDVLVDMAAYAPTNRVDISALRPDFTAFSFYKLFGFPTGIGCLLVRRDKLDRLERPWFAGGTITIASVQGDGYYLHDDEAAFEDGTIDYLNIPAVETGLRYLDEVGIDVVHDRVMALTDWLLHSLARLRHSNGTRVVDIFGPEDTRARGGTVTFAMYDPDRRPIDDRRVEELANRVNISIRTGCFCNPGAGEIAHRLTADQMGEFFGRPDAVSFLDLRSDMLAKYDLLVSAIRVSVGVATNFTDVYRFLCFVQGFVDKSVDEIGAVEFVSDNCRVLRDSA